MSQNSAYSLGNHLLHLGMVTSTNDLARQLLDEQIAHHGTFIRADMQSKGRGQEGNSWESERGANLLCSLVLVPSGIPVDRQVLLNISVCLAVRDMVQGYCPLHPVTIKWPNDVYVGDFKIAGILIENALMGHALRHAIVGIGVNINQQQFSYSKACSLATITHHEYDVSECGEVLLSHLKYRYEQWISNRYDTLWNEYQEYLYKKDKLSSFEIAGHSVEGTVKGIDESGRLCLQVGETIQVLNVKEIKWL